MTELAVLCPERIMLVGADVMAMPDVLLSEDVQVPILTDSVSQLEMPLQPLPELNKEDEDFTDAVWRSFHWQQTAEDSSPGVMSLAIEPKTEPEVDMQNGAQSSTQLHPDPARDSAYDAIMRANAQRACASCQALCCRAFFINPTYMEDGEHHQGKEGQLAFRKKHFIPLPLLDNLGGRNTQGWHTCSALDWRNNRCTAYNDPDKPEECRRFLCGTAVGGCAPTKGMMWQGLTDKQQTAVYRLWRASQT